VEDGRFSRPCGPGAPSRASQKTNLELRRHANTRIALSCLRRMGGVVGRAPRSRIRLAKRMSS
jgi:hypothetical protein